MEDKKVKACPECGKVWTQEEIDLQECSGCGYPEDDILEDVE